MNCVKRPEAKLVVAGFMPALTAATSAMTLNADPGWRLASAARLNFEVAYFADDAIARMYPLDGSIDTIADEGAPRKSRLLAIAARAFFWRSRSIVVWIRSPPPRTFLTPYCLMSSSVT